MSASRRIIRIAGLATACFEHGADEHERVSGHRNRHITRRNARIARLRAKVRDEVLAELG